MRESGCVLLKMGVQSFSPGTLKAMRRATDADRGRSTVIEAERLGISMHYDMLTCFPGETEDDHRCNLRTIEEIFGEADSVYFSLNPFYLAIGSDTHLNAGRYSIEVRHFDPDTLPGPLADTVRASGDIPVGFTYDLPRDVVLRRVRELGKILERHGRDYLYLGQVHVPPDSGAFRKETRGEGSDADSVRPLYRELLRPWRAGASRKGWVLGDVLPVSGGEDGLVKYLFRSGEGPEGGQVSVRLARRHEDRPCFVRTKYFNVFYDGTGADGPGGPDIEALLGMVVEAIRRNEIRLSAALRTEES
jgi:hypothetical protein